MASKSEEYCRSVTLHQVAEFQLDPFTRFLKQNVSIYTLKGLGSVSIAISTGLSDDAFVSITRTSVFPGILEHIVNE